MSDISFCCAECFSHEWLCSKIRDESQLIGTCVHCESSNVPLLKAKSLRHAFENVMTLYSRVMYGENLLPEEDPIDVGEYAAVLIQEDFALFSDLLDDDRKQSKLLDAILRHARYKDDGPAFDSTELYTRRETLFDISLRQEWEGFCAEVKRNPTADWEYDGIKRWIRRAATALTAGTVLFRARLGYDQSASRRRPYSGSDIGVPPTCAAGRVNDVGQRVLYCAGDAATAVSEVRPFRGEYVSVCEIKIKTDVEIADLERGLIPPNPFLAVGLRRDFEIYEILRSFSRQLSRPLDRRDDQSDYIPCRYLANRVRAGLGGIRYGSAMRRGGSNIVLFDPHSCEVLGSRLVRVTDLNVQYDFRA